MRKGTKHSEETKKKIAKTQEDRFKDPNERIKLSESLKGRLSPNKGKSASPETRLKMSKSRMGKTPWNKGIPQSDEVKLKLAEANRGRIPHNKGVPTTLEQRLKISASLKGRLSPNKGKNLSPETRKKISIAHMGMPQTPETRAKISKSICGKNHPNWQGGISYEPYCPKWTPELRRRIRSFFGHQCLLCGKSAEENGKQLSCHHVEYNKNACCDGRPVQFAALCHSCHAKTGSKRNDWENMIHIIINEIYNGRSYYTKEEWVDINAELRQN